MDQPTDRPEQQPSESPQDAVLCPYCGVAIEQKPARQPQMVLCSSCKQAFLLPSIDGQVSELAQPADPPAEAQPADGGFAIEDDYVHDKRPDDLDGFRIRQVLNARRTAYRSRSYCLIGAVMCVVLAGELVWKIIEHLRGHWWGVTSTLYVVAIPLCFFYAFRFYHRSEMYRAEAEESKLPEPDRPPDFTDLSDGSQQWKNLEG